MVARPPLKLTIEAMRLEDLAEVQRIEQASFSTPWPENAYRSELMTNRLRSPDQKTLRQTPRCATQ